MTRETLEKILRGLSIPFKDEPRAININCPFCRGQTHGRYDDRFRCGIFPENLRFHCFRCHRTGSLYKILSQMFGLSQEEYASIVGSPRQPSELSLTELVKKNINGVKEIEQNTTVPKIPKSRLVTYELVEQNPLLRRFLDSRQITVDTCLEYWVRYTGSVGEHAQRLIIPIFDDKDKIVAWQGRDVSGKAKSKYFTQGDISKQLYWSCFSMEPNRIYLVEGVFDCWRMEHNAVSCFGKQLSSTQRAALVTDDMIDELVICWDSDAYEDALRVSRDLAPIIKAGVVRLPEGEDPDSYGSDGVRELEIRWA